MYRQNIAAIWRVFTRSAVGPHHVAKCKRSEQDGTSRDAVQSQMSRGNTTSYVLLHIFFSVTFMYYVLFVHVRAH